MPDPAELGAVPVDGGAGGRGGGLDPRTAALVALGIVAVYVPSLGGGLAWDDRYLVRSGGWGDVVAAWGRGVWDGVSEGTDLYRPLATSLSAVIQALGGGVLGERVVSLGMHVGVALTVGAVAVELGATRRAAAVAALFFGLHAGCSEPVAWITGRHDLLPALLVVLAWRLLGRGRDAVAGLLLGLSAFAKEPYLLAAIVPLAWGWSAETGPGWAARGRALAARWRAVVGAGIGAVACVGIRTALGRPLPVGAAATDPLGALGALAERGVALLFVPSSADACALYAPEPLLGVLVVALGLGLLWAARGRPSLGPLLGALVLAAPSGPASAQIGLVADRYFYLVFAAVAVAAAVGGTRLAALATGRAPAGTRTSAGSGRPAMVVVACLAGLLGLGTAQRAVEWGDDRSLFGASVNRDPVNPYAAFHLGSELQREGDCAGAVPLLRLGLATEARAGNNLQACLLDLGSVDEAAAMGPDLLKRDASSVTPARNTARALAQLGRPADALEYAKEAARRDGGRPASLVLVGQLSGQVGDLDGAEAAFRGALAVDPSDGAATAGLAAVARARGAAP